MMKLQPITHENFSECIKLKRGNSNYVGDSAHVLAEGYINKDYSTVFGLYNESVMVGLVMLVNEPNEESRCIFTNLFIADNWQHKGYGKQAIQSIIKYFKSMNNAKYIEIYASNSNTVALAMYYNLGFENTGLSKWDENFSKLIFNM